MGFQSEKLYNIESIWIERCRTQVIGANKSPSSIGRTGRSFRRDRRWQTRICLKFQGHSLFDLYYIHPSTSPGLLFSLQIIFFILLRFPISFRASFAWPPSAAPRPPLAVIPAWFAGFLGSRNVPAVDLILLFFFYRFAPSPLFFPFNLIPLRPSFCSLADSMPSC